MRWLKSCFLLFGSLIVISISGGCALTPPSSEALIFQRSEPSNRPVLKSPKYDYSSPQPEPGFLNIVASATASPRGSAELDYAKDKYAPFIEEKLSGSNNLTEENLVIRNPHYFSLGIPITLMNHKKVRWALNVGFPVLGMDATTPIGDQTYLTVNLGFGDGELIIQQKLTQTQTGGLALGGFYRTERRGFEITEDELSIVPFVPLADALSADRTFYNHILGARVNGFLNLGSGSFLQLRAAPGYAVNLKQPILNFSLSINLN